MVVSEQADRILDDLDDIDVEEPSRLSLKKEQSIRYNNEQRHQILLSEEKKTNR